MSEFYPEEEISSRRKELLIKIGMLMEKYPGMNITDVTSDLTDDQLEIIYLKKFIEVEDRTKFKDTLEKLAGVLGGMFPQSKNNEDKPDLVIHHIIKF